MENIKWLHWFWITLLCVIIPKHVTLPLNSSAEQQKSEENNNSTISSNLTSLHSFLLPSISLNQNAEDSKNLEEEFLLQNDSSVITHLTPIPELMNKTNIKVINESFVEESINRTANTSLELNDRIENLDLNENTTSFISTNNSLETHNTSLISQISSNIDNKLKSLTSEEEPAIDSQLIQRIPSKLIKSDTFLLSSTTAKATTASSLLIESNFTNSTILENLTKRKAKGLSSEYRSDGSEKNLLTRSINQSIDKTDEHIIEEGNVSSEALSNQSMDPGLISGICFSVFALFCGVGLSGLILYKKRSYLNKPHALSEPDSGYIDDSIIRDTNSDELYSLDNDSFLNSLEAMTIQNYWSDSVKHTKL